LLQFGTADWGFEFMSQVVLIVDDDPVQRRLIENMVQRFGYRALTAEGGDAAAALLTGPQQTRIDCVILDLVMPDLDGMGVLARMRAAGCNIPVIVQTAHGGIDNVVSAMRAGAVDFVVKPTGVERLQVSLRNALAANALAGELQRIKRSRDGTMGFADVITRASVMKGVLRAAEKAAASAIPALIEGESGVGKELIARAIHGSSERRAKPFVAVNCGALPENLVESILFGHEKGAFTGATERHSGKFAEADGGTLFLDEIGELPLTAQVKLLRALQQGEIEPVGGRKPVKVDVRIVSATNRDLIAGVKAGRFREDLFYRLHVFPITVPPLRARPEDIAELARHFLARFAAEEGKRVSAIGADALALLCDQAWPGNVRQLENAIFRAVVLAEGETLSVNEFPQLARGHEGNGAASPAMPGIPMLHEEMPMAPRAFGELTTPQASLPLTDAQDHVRTLDEIERDVIRFAISHYRGQMSEVARRLQIGRSTLYRKLESLGLEQQAAEHADVN
jgi:DNA-binding NtrC family response regulator